MNVKIPLGIESFEKMRENGYYYADKTNFIKELLGREYMVNLITRPRRFGKSLTMSMLEDFFDISKDSKKHFEGLSISNDTELCENWLNRYPVVFISFKDIAGNTFEDAYDMLKWLVSGLCLKFNFLQESCKVNPVDKKTLVELQNQNATAVNLKGSLLLLTRMLTAHYGKKTILLVDEYDVPLADANTHGYYKEMLAVIRAMLGTVLKSNDYLELAVVTGCLRISKESIFTGLNNLVVNAITMERFDECIGFTEEDVRNLLAETGFTDHAQEIREWYDGYRFGDADVYCPWDVLNHVAALMDNPETEPQSYWGSTSSNNVIMQVLEHAEADVGEKFETLLKGESIVVDVTETLTYDTMMGDESSLWSLLFMTGYLTREKNTASEKTFRLKIPNEEIKDIFRKNVVSRFKNKIETIDRGELIQALWEGDTAKSSRIISDILFKTISYYDYKESYYHAFVAGLMVGAGYIVESNYERGLGRPDIVVKDKNNRRVILFEAKHADENETIEHACKEALKQIKEKRYAESLTGYRTEICYGVAFKGKDCLIEQLMDKRESR